MNRRNAVFGWAVWAAGKKAMKIKAKPRRISGRISALIVGLATAVGLAYVARRLVGDDSDGE